MLSVSEPSPKWLVLLRFSDQIFVCISAFLLVLHPPFIADIIAWTVRVKITKFPLRNNLYPTVSSSFGSPDALGVLLLCLKYRYASQSKYIGSIKLGHSPTSDFLLENLFSNVWGKVMRKWVTWKNIHWRFLTHAYPSRKARPEVEGGWKWNYISQSELEATWL